jgi:hypothetical protein
MASVLGVHIVTPDPVTLLNWPTRYRSKPVNFWQAAVASMRCPVADRDRRRGWTEHTNTHRLYRAATVCCAAVVVALNHPRSAETLVSFQSVSVGLTAVRRL